MLSHNHNRTHKYVNKFWNEKLKTDDSLLIKEDVNDEYTQGMYIYKDLPVTSRKTKKKGDVCMNSEAFEVLHNVENSIHLGTTRSNDNGEPERHSIDVEFKDFTEISCLNYCLTTHFSQGESITEDFTIYD